MKPQEQFELQAILNAERSLRDARLLMARGKRTLAKRIALLREASDIIDAHLTLQLMEDKPEIQTIDQPELPEQPAEAQ